MKAGKVSSSSATMLEPSEGDLSAYTCGVWIYPLTGIRALEFNAGWERRSRG